MTTTATLKDARKFVNDVGANLPIVLTADKSQGNFHSFEAMNTWLKKNGSYNNRVIIRGPMIVPTGTVLSFPNKVIFEGESAVLSTTAGGDVTFELNCEFRNMKFSGDTDWTMTSSVFMDCQFTDSPNLTINSNNTFVRTTFPNNPIISFMGDKNFIEFDHCSFTLDTSFQFSGCHDIIFKKTTINMEGVLSGTGMTFIECLNVLFEDCNLFGGFQKGIDFTDASSITFRRSTIETLFTPNVGFVTSDLVNTGNGNLYCGMFTSVSDIIIDDCRLIYSGAGTTHYPYINFEFKDEGAQLFNLKVLNNKFSNDGDASSDDKRAAIAIINTIAGGTGSTLKSIMTDVEIKNNICSKNQLIVMSSPLNESTRNLEYPGLAAINCTVSGNRCGTIGYWLAAGNPIQSSITLSTIEPRNSGLIIEGNSCHYIASLDWKGKSTIDDSGVNFSDSKYISCNVLINKNICNWIHTSVAFADATCLVISNNSFTAFNVNYLSSYNIVGGFSATIPLNGFNNAIVVISKGGNTQVGLQTIPGNSAFSPCVIEGNVTQFGTIDFNGIDSSPYVYRYSGYVMCMSNCTIKGNVFKGIDSNAPFDVYVPPTYYSPVRGIILGGYVSIVTNNQIHRGSSTIDNYMAIANPVFVIDSDTTGIVTDNYFDKSTPDDVSQIHCLFNKRWIYEKNINQIKSVLIPMTANRETPTSVYSTFGPIGRILDVWADGQWQLVDQNDASYMSIIAFSTGSRGRYTIPINLNTYLPRGVGILTVSYNVWASQGNFDLGTASGSPNNYFRLRVVKEFPAAAAMDVKAIITSAIIHDGTPLFGSFDVTSSGNETALKAGNVTVSVSTGGPSSIYRLSDDTNGDGIVNAIVEFGTRMTGATQINVYVSPLLVKYIW